MSATLGPPPGGVIRAPRLMVTVNGAALPAPISASVTQTNAYTAAQFDVVAAIQPSDAMNAAFFANTTNLRIVVNAGFESSGAVRWTKLIIGDADEVSLSPDYSTATLTGRDLTALLIDAKTATDYRNQTSSEIAALLAQSVGLTPVVTATTTPVGRYYAIDHDRLALGGFHHAITEWDLLVYLAQYEGYDVFVSGTSLYFQPPASPQSTPWVARWSPGNTASGMTISGTIMNLQMNRSLTIAKDAKVVVKSWHSGLRVYHDGTASKFPSNLTATAVGAAGKAASGTFGPEQTYVFYRPNLTPEQAQTLANQKLAEITRHERVIDFDCPGELMLTPQMMVQLTGTGTAFDQLYHPDEISRTISFDGGFVQHVRAKNHTTNSQADLAVG